MDRDFVTKEKAYRIIVDPIPVKENEGMEVVLYWLF